MIQRKFTAPTEEEIENRKKVYEKADVLGIDLISFDRDGSAEERKDVRRAIIFLSNGESIPEGLRKRLLDRKNGNRMARNVK